MSHLTRVLLNSHRRGCRHLLSSPQRMHAAVLSSFPPGASAPTPEGRVLWRVDPLPNGAHALYIASPAVPDVSSIVEQAGWNTAEGTPLTRSLDPLLDGLREGQAWRFRVTVNPTYTRADERDAQGRSKVLAHVTAAQQVRWFKDRAGGRGFALLTSEELGGDQAQLAVPGERGSQEGDEQLPVLDLVERSTRRFERQGRTVTLQQATFEGALRVTDVDEFRHLLTHGLGRAKGYGCGLMTLSR